MKFELQPHEIKVFNKWFDEHVKSCKYWTDINAQGAIGGALTYEFTPTGLGSFISVRCACGETKSLTDFASL